MYYVYRFLDKSKNVIYVGKSKQDLKIRFAGHSHLPNDCYAMVHKIEFIACSTESDMSIKEIYYINKYKNDKHYFFNVLDTSELPKSVEFDDKWKMYRGPLPARFSRSLNYKNGYSEIKKEDKHNKNCSLNTPKKFKEQEPSNFVEPFDCKEVELIINYFIDEINNAENSNQEQLRIRNLVIFVLGVNLPIKPSELLSMKYRDLFDCDDIPKAYELKLKRYHEDEILKIPLNSNTKSLIVAYRQRYNLFYKNSAEEGIFISRKHQNVSAGAWWRILSIASDALKIKKSIGAESLRKTYGLNIYKKSKNKIKALMFLSELWGQIREAKIINYLGLTDNNIDFSYFFDESFSIGKVDLSKINCLKNYID